jgi:hypothetical protein
MLSLRSKSGFKSNTGFSIKSASKSGLSSHSKSATPSFMRSVKSKSKSRPTSTSLAPSFMRSVKSKSKSKSRSRSRSTSASLAPSFIRSVKSKSKSKSRPTSTSLAPSFIRSVKSRSKSKSSSKSSSINQNSIPIDVLLNVILVQEGVRNAMLIQPQDYGEADGNGSKTRSILDYIKREFSELIQSHDYEEYQGIIISKTDYNHKTISLEDMGELLSYPCYKDYDEINISDINHYAIGIYANVDGIRKELIVNACKDKSIEIKFNQIAKQAQSAFDHYKETLLHNKDITVNVVTTAYNSTRYIVGSIIDGKDIDEEMLFGIYQNVIDFETVDGDGTTTLQEFKREMTPLNDIKRGCIIFFLMCVLFDPISPYYPLENYPTLNVKSDINEIRRLFINKIHTLLESSEEQINQEFDIKKTQIENFSESESNTIYKDQEYKDVINSLSQHINRDNIICKVFGILFLFLFDENNIMLAVSQIDDDDKKDISKKKCLYLIENLTFILNKISPIQSRSNKSKSQKKKSKSQKKKSKSKNYR